MTRQYTITRLSPKKSTNKAQSLNAAVTAIRQTKDISPVVTLTADEIIGKAINTLIDIMGHKDDHALRIKAAMGLLQVARELRFVAQARQNRDESDSCLENDEARRNEKEEHAAAIADARTLLAEIAEVRSGSVCKPSALDQNGAAGATDAAG